MTSLPEFLSTPSIINGGGAITYTFFSGNRHFAVLHGRFAPLTATQAALLRSQGYAYAVGDNVFPLSITTYPSIAVGTSSSRRRLGDTLSSPNTPEVQDWSEDAADIVNNEEGIQQLLALEAQMMNRQSFWDTYVQLSSVHVVSIAAFATATVFLLRRFLL